MNDKEVVKASSEAVKAASELLKPFTELFAKLCGPAAEEIGLTLGDHFRAVRAKRLARLLASVAAELQNAHIEAKPVKLKLLKPILEHGSMEEDDVLQDKWASLLTNASIGNLEIPPAYPEVLKQLTHDEVAFLSLMYERFVSVKPKSLEDGFIPTRGIRLGYMSDIQRTLLYYEEKGDIQISTLAPILIANLERLGLVSRNVKVQPRGPIYARVPKISRMEEPLPTLTHEFELTPFAILFVRACSKPSNKK